MKDFEAILEECIDLIANGEATFDECLIRYPEYAAQLEPILYTAGRLKQGREVTPSPYLRARIRAELKEKRKKGPRQKNTMPVFFWRRALNTALLLFVLLIASTYLAQDDLPGDALYPWKLASERFWRAATVDPLGTDLKLSDRRIGEYVAVSDEERRKKVLLGYNKLLVRFEDEENETEQARIQTVLKSQRDLLRGAGLSIPELENYFLERGEQISR